MRYLLLALFALFVSACQTACPAPTPCPDCPPAPACPSCDDAVNACKTSAAQHLGEVNAQLEQCQAQLQQCQNPPAQAKKTKRKK